MTHEVRYITNPTPLDELKEWRDAIARREGAQMECDAEGGEISGSGDQSAIHWAAADEICFEFTDRGPELLDFALQAIEALQGCLPLVVCGSYADKHMKRARAEAALERLGVDW